MICKLDVLNQCNRCFMFISNLKKKMLIIIINQFEFREIKISFIIIYLQVNYEAIITIAE